MDVDVAVVGAGPVGCAAALAHARRGARVALLDPCADGSQRFAGELLHPTALALLRTLGVTRLPTAEAHGPHRGFAVYLPGAAPRTLQYSGAQGATLPFDDLVHHLRDVAAAHPLVRWMPRCKVQGVDGQTLTYEDRRHAGATATLRAGRIVAADGRFSALRRSLLGEPDREPLSRMAGLTLRGVTLPFERHGHVVLSRVGPALVYRIGPDTVRVCLDVPAPWFRAERRERLLWETYGEVLPEVLRPAVRHELEAGRIAWAINAVTPRTAYGRPGLVLVGDAVGTVHPMTAIGITLGLGDAVALARHDDLAAYARERRRDTQAPALLSTALYEVFTVQSDATRALREAIGALWTDPELRRRTMAFLSCEDVSMRRLVNMGSRMVARAAWALAHQGARSGAWRPALADVRRVAGLVHWLTVESVPEPMRIPWVTRAATPFAALRHDQTARLAELSEPA